MFLNFGLTQTEEAIVKNILFLFCCIIAIDIDAVLIHSLPKEINTKIIDTIPLSPWLETVEEVNVSTKSLACVNKAGNLYINDPENTRSLIKKCADRFHIYDIEVAEKLSIKEARARYVVQTSALVVLKEPDPTLIDRHLNKIASSLDLNFTYSSDFLSKPTLLMAASDLSSYYSNRAVMAKWLIKKGADINVLDEYKENALMIAIGRFNFELIDMLLTHAQFKLTHVDCQGDTLLHYCIKSPHTSSENGMAKYEKMCPVIVTLLERGIDRHALNNKGQTALDIAKSYSFKYEPFFELLDPDYNLQKDNSPQV